MHRYRVIIETLEATTLRTPLEDRDLQVRGLQGPVRPAESHRSQPDDGGQVKTGFPCLLEAFHDRVGVSAEGSVVGFVNHGSVIEDVEELIAIDVKTDLRNQNLDLEWFHLVGEDLAYYLRVLVRETAGIDVFAAVYVALLVYISLTFRSVELAFSATITIPPS